MTDQPRKSSKRRSAVSADGCANLDRVQELTWSLLDEDISDEEFEQLSRALLRDDKSSNSYIGCVQLHTDLLEHFGGRAASTKKPANGPQILGLPGGDLPFGLQSSSAEEATS